MGSRPITTPPDWEEPEGEDWKDPRERVFVARYLLHANGARAVREAGYETRTPAGQTNRATALLKKPYIREYINAERKRLQETLKFDVQRITEELAKAAFFNLGAISIEGPDGETYIDLRRCDANDWAAIKSITYEETSTIENPEFEEHEYERDQAEALAEGRAPEYDVPRHLKVRKVKIEAYNKLDALNALGRHLKMFVDRTETSVTIADPDRIKAARERARQARKAEGEDDA